MNNSPVQKALVLCASLSSEGDTQLAVLVTFRWIVEASDHPIDGAVFCSHSAWALHLTCLNFIASSISDDFSLSGYR